MSTSRTKPVVHVGLEEYKRCLSIHTISCNMQHLFPFGSSLSPFSLVSRIRVLESKLASFEVQLKLLLLPKKYSRMH